MNIPPDQQEFIEQILPHRLDALATLHLVVRYVISWEEPKPMEIKFDKLLCIDGLSTAFTNPVLESGILHCRALLEFLGLKIDPKNHNKLVQRNSSRHGDLIIEDFSGPNGRLKPITVEEAVAYYKGDPSEAELAFACIIHLANKGIAHSTSGLIEYPDGWRLLEIASRGIPSLIVSRFYTPMCLQPPESKISQRKRELSFIQSFLSPLVNFYKRLR